MTIPWSKIPKAPLDTLIDLPARLAILLGEMKRLNTHGTSFGTRLFVISRCQAFMMDLQSWDNNTIQELKAYKLQQNDNTILSNNFAQLHTPIIFFSISLVFCTALSSLLPEGNIPIGVQLFNMRQNIIENLPSCLK
jgi:hypothetical protein